MFIVFLIKMTNYTEYEYFNCRGMCVFGYICGLVLVSSLIGICFEYILPTCKKKPQDTEMVYLVEDANKQDEKYYNSLEDIKPGKNT